MNTVQILACYQCLWPRLGYHGLYKHLAIIHFLMKWNKHRNLNPQYKIAAKSKDLFVCMYDTQVCKIYLFLPTFKLRTRKHITFQHSAHKHKLTSCFQYKQTQACTRLHYCGLFQKSFCQMMSEYAIKLAKNYSLQKPASGFVSFSKRAR